jgi:hypothetical protein
MLSCSGFLSRASTVPESQVNDMTIVGLGDSILLQTNHIIGQMFKDKGLTYLHPEKSENGNHWHDQGETNVGITMNLHGYLDKIQETHGKVDAMLVHVGLHDIKRPDATGRPQREEEAYGADVRSAMVHAASVARHVFFTTIPRILDDHHNAYNTGMKRFDRDAVRYNTIMRRHADGLGIHIIDTHALFDITRENLADHVHLTRDSEHTYARLLADAVMAVLEKETTSS